MWTNKSSRIEVPPYAPPVMPGKTDAIAAIYVLKETENVGTGPSPRIPSLGTLEHSSSRLGANLRVKGEISGNEDLFVEGSVDGLIQMEGGKLTVGPDAKIAADILAAEILVYGEVKGNLCARDRIEIKKNGSVLGELTTSRIMIEDGAYFKGSIEIDRKVAATSEHRGRASGEAPLLTTTSTTALT
jgi:cytoskeletal protein CcmA (bactofilin family)